MEKINKQRRVAMGNKFYKMDYNARRACIHGVIEQKVNVLRRMWKYERSLICTLNFFENSWVWRKKNIHYNCFQPDSINSKRGKQGLVATKYKYNREILQKDLSSIQPCISHYWKEHAPNHLCVPHDTTEADLEISAK